MKRLIVAVLVVPLFIGALFAQSVKDQEVFGPVATGVAITALDRNGSGSFAFEEVLAGSPATVSIATQGCMRGGTCATLNTNTSTSSARITVAGGYDYYTITPTFTGGTAPTLTVYKSGIESAVSATQTVSGTVTAAQATAASLNGQVQGTVATGAAIPNPVITGGANAAGNSQSLLADVKGLNVHGSTGGFSCVVAVSTATSIQAVGGSCATPGAGLSLYITDIAFGTSAAAGTAADSFPTIKSGSGGTCGTATAVIWQALTTANSTIIENRSTPIKVAANSEICWIMTTAGSKTLQVSGFIAP